MKNTAFTHVLPFSILVISGLVVTSVTRAAPSPTAPQNEIMVTLFGQPCLLAGPNDKETLKAIHAISPEQTFVDLSAPSADSIRKVVEKLRNSKTTPTALEAYRTNKLKRLESLLAFANGLAAAKNTKKSEPLLNAVKPLVSPRNLKTLASLAAALDSKKLDPNLELKLADSFSEMIEPDPEEEFHRAIRRMNIHYSCEFSDEGDAEEETPDPAEAASAPKTN